MPPLVRLLPYVTQIVTKCTVCIGILLQLIYISNAIPVKYGNDVR